MTNESMVVARWCSGAKMMSLAYARGWTEDSQQSIIDLVEENEAEEERVFPTVAKAKGWARRNKKLDFWSQPSVIVYNWPRTPRRSWERETVKHLRYCSGDGWEDLSN